MQRLYRRSAFILLVAGPTAASQSILVPLAPDRWIATDSLRFEDHLGRASLYIDKGVALARGVSLQNGTLEFDMAATQATNFMGAAFRARSLDNSEVIFFRLGSSGTSEAVQYGPALNNVGVAWQVYHGDGANAVANVTRERWIHVMIELAGPVAAIYLDSSAKPTLTVPRLAGAGGAQLGVWAGAFGRGAYFSNVRYSVHLEPLPEPPPVRLPAGTIVDWDLSNTIDPSSFTPSRLPDVTKLAWDRVRAEPPGIVLINRYRAAPRGSVPVDSATGQVLQDSVMTGKVAGSKIVYARTTIQSDRARLRRMHFGYSDGIVIYANGQPLFFAMNPPFFRDLGIMSTIGDAVYLRLKKGRNEVVVAVPELSGGWAFWARLDP